MKLGITFNLPFRFMDEGKYEFPYQKVSVRIDVKLVQNFEGSEKIMGVKVVTSGEGAKADMKPDHHGLVNFTQVKIEVQDRTDCNLDCLIEKYGDNTDGYVKDICILFLNRLAEVVRSTTNNYWIRFISLRDIMNFQVLDLSVDPPKFFMSMHFGHGYSFPNFQVIEQAQVKDQINNILKEQINIPTWKNLFLDAVNYFTIARYNEAVITVNVALESFIAQHLFNKLNQKSPEKITENRDEILLLPKSLHQTLTKHFHKIDGRDFKESSNLWKEFDDLRIVRTHATHSFTRKISPQECYKVIQDIMSIINWIDPSIKNMLK